MNLYRRESPRLSANRPIRLHFYGEQVDTTVSEDISQGGFFVRTDTVRNLEKGMVVLVTTVADDNTERRCLAEVVRVTQSGAAFSVFEQDIS